jgi:hypothetical protein
MERVPDPDIEEIDAGAVVWRFERSFLTSNWTCLWGRGCQGILPSLSEHLAQGCCSFGAEVDEDEAPTIAALATMLTPDQFQHHAAAAEGGIFRDERRSWTRLVDGACIFLNRPDFAGGAGCALHRAALEDGVSPIDSKPSVCWQLPIHVDWEVQTSDTEIATVRRWARADWGAEGPPMAWVCTEETDAYVGEQPVIDSLADELAALVGDEVYVELRRRIVPLPD